MAQRFSISTKQAVLTGLGITALLGGIAIAVLASRKKKKQLQSKQTQKTNNTKSIMV
jgi:hypothetical protein